MKREDVLALVPGYNLDVLVAEKVLGWKMKEYHDCPGSFGPDWMDGEAVAYEVEEFNPSIDISAAWEVEEQIKTLRLHVEYCQALRKVVMSKGEYVGLFDYIHATPEQRCKAALLAVLEEGEEA